LSDLALVTGSTGFLGSWICRALLNQGYRVRALHRETSSLLAIQNLPVERVTGDILEPQSLNAAMQGVRFVFHAAAQSDYWRNPKGVLRTSVDGTRNVCAAALSAGVKRLVLTSSISAMGLPQGDELLDESHTYNLGPNDFPYGYAKRRAEVVALEAIDRGLDVVITNPSIVLGPGDINQISGSMVIQAARGRTFLWMKGGVNFIHVEDAAQGHLRALSRGASGERYILGNENLTHREVFTQLARIVDEKPPWLHLPHALVPLTAAMIDGLNHIVQMPLSGSQLRMASKYIFCDTSKSRRELDFSAQHSFYQAALEAFHWYQEHSFI
jgi:dihydroflavonol-4-reductase